MKIKSTTALFAISLALTFQSCNQKKAPDYSSIAIDTTSSDPNYTGITEDTTSVTPGYQWSYSEKQDKMTSKTNKWATVDADELLQFASPYDGGVTASLVIRKKDGLDIMFRISKGQIITSVDDSENRCRIKFDDESPKSYGFTTAADYSSDVIFFTSTSTLLKKIKKAKKMIVEVQFYQEGNRQIEFNVEGLKWD